MRSGSYDADVIVVGCGPVGVMAALRCAQRGLSVIAIDRSTEIYPLPRALGMDDEIQELIARAGLLEEFKIYSVPLPGGEFVDASGRQVVGIDRPPGTVGALGLPPLVTFNQPAVERMLRTAARSAGVDMRLGLGAFAVQDIEGGVRLELGDDGGDTSITARWAIAADGAKSTIRSRRGIEMMDQGFDQTWLVVDTTLVDPDLPLPRLARQQCDPARMCTFVPGPGRHRRWEFRLGPDEGREAVLDEAVIADLLSPWGTPGQLEVDRAAVYRFHANVADTFRDGPVFLAGDAAHQMPPFNGQGMCTGMRDVENLSWKLAAVAQGHAGDALLDTYDEERRPHAAQQVAHSVDSGLLMEAIADDGDAALETGYGQRPFPKLTGSMFATNHDRVGTILPNATTAKPIPLGDGWKLLRLGVTEAVPELWAQLGATVHDITENAFPGIATAGSTVIVRPDRYIAAVTHDLNATTNAIGAVATGDLSSNLNQTQNVDKETQHD